MKDTTRPASPGAKPRKQRERMPVMVRGQLFENYDACAAHFKVKPGTVRNLVARGRPDAIGLGRGGHMAGRTLTNRRVVPVTVMGVAYPSMRQAALALGLSYNRLRYIIRNPLKKRPPVEMPTTTCQECGVTFTRRRSKRGRCRLESLTQFRKRRFCSCSCSARSANRARHHPGTVMCQNDSTPT